MPDLRGKVALVTGASKGIGYACADALAEAGANLALCSRNGNEVARAAKGISERRGVKAFGSACDVRDRGQVESLVAETKLEYGRLDILVANAGVGHFGAIDELTHEQWDEVIGTNLTGVFNVCRAVVPTMKRYGGWIVTIGSLAGRNTFAGGAAYNASKFGLLGFTEALMLDLRYHGIRVSTIMPGHVDSGWRGREPGLPENAWMLKPEDVARCLLSLLDHDPRSLPSKVELRPSMPAKGRGD